MNILHLLKLLLIIILFQRILVYEFQIYTRIGGPNFIFIFVKFFFGAGEEVACKNENQAKAL